MSDGGPGENPRAPATDTGAVADTGADSARAEDAGRDWQYDRPPEDEHLGSLWIRWTDGGADLHLHRICRVLPQVQRTDSPPFVRLVPESGERPTFVPVRPGNGGDGDGDDDDDGDDRRDAEGEQSEVQFKFVDGLPRQLLRHVPLVVLVAAVVLFVGAEFSPRIGGVSDLLPPLSGRNATLFLLYLSITPVLLWLLSTVDVVEYREFPKAAVVYGLVVALAGGVGVSVLLVVTAESPTAVEPNVVFVSGYLLVLLVGGQLLYEGILRIEHLFVKFGQRDNDIVGNERAYRAFLTELQDGLRTTVLGLSPSRLFGVLFAAQFALIWIIGLGPQNLDYSLGLVVNVGFNAVLGTVFFQFLVLVRYFNHLMSATSKFADVELTYEPFHVDGHGGFRDLGRFATRINLILSLAGLYLVYRLYIVGSLGLPADGLVGFTDPILLTAWLVSFVGPVVAYAAGVGAWGYYSFWSMHAKMVRDKYTLARKYQGSRRDVDLDRTPAAGDYIDSFDDSEGPAWDALRNAPTWPLDVNKLVSLLSGNALPLLLPASNFLF